MIIVDKHNNNNNNNILLKKFDLKIVLRTIKERVIDYRKDHQRYNDYHDYGVQNIYYQNYCLNEYQYKQMSCS